METVHKSITIDHERLVNNPMKKKDQEKIRERLCMDTAARLVLVNDDHFNIITVQKPNNDIECISSLTVITEEERKEYIELKRFVSRLHTLGGQLNDN